MQGGGDNINKDKEINVYDYVVSEIRNMPQFNDFLDIKKFKWPKDIKEFQENISINFQKFKGNYILLFLMFAILFLVFKPKAVIFAFIWILYFYMKKRDVSFIIFNYEVKTEHMLPIAIGASFVLLILLNSVIIVAMCIFSLFVLTSFSHLCLYDTKLIENI